MGILAKYLPFVKEQSAFHKKNAERFKDNTFRTALHKQTAEKFDSLATDLEAADKALEIAPTEAPKPAQPKRQIQLSLSIEDVQGLPEELVQELSISDGDKTEFAIVNAIEEAGGIISLDRLLIALYKKTSEIHKRTYLTSRLARMAQKNAIYYVPGKKGIYSTEQLSAEDVSKLLGVAKQDA
jgi:hypothetical protein